MTEVHFHPYDSEIDPKLGFAVIAARHCGQWLFCRHRERSTWELPGGHREPGENILSTARRELREETGAAEFELTAVCVYEVRGERIGYGILCFAEVETLGQLPPMEIAEVIHSDRIPAETTYPQIQPLLLKHVEEWLEARGNSAS